MARAKSAKAAKGAGEKRWKGAMTGGTDATVRPGMRMESARIATLRLMMAQEKGILPLERSATVATTTQQEPQTDIDLKQSWSISFLHSSRSMLNRQTIR